MAHWNYIGIIYTTLNWIKVYKDLSQYDRPRVLRCEPVDGVMVVLSSNQLNIAMFVHQMGDVCLSSAEQMWQYLFDLNLEQLVPHLLVRINYSRSVILVKVQRGIYFWDNSNIYFHILQNSLKKVSLYLLHSIFTARKYFIHFVKVSRVIYLTQDDLVSVYHHQQAMNQLMWSPHWQTQGILTFDNFFCQSPHPYLHFLCQNPIHFLPQEVGISLF